MNSNLIRPVQKPAEYMQSIYCNTPDVKARDLPGMVSVNMRDLFPILPEPCYINEGDDLSVIAKKTREALEKVDMSDITPETSVNIVCAEHGFCICGGAPYIQMLKTLREVVLERTGCIDLRLRVVMWRTPKEGQEAIDFYKLEEEFDNNVDYSWAYDKPVAIETRIGTLYGLEKVYDADKIILAYYDDPREVWFSNMYRKSFKAFTMNMARFETRSVYHETVGKWNAGVDHLASIVPTSIYDSDFVQSKWAFGCYLTSTPAGVDGVVAGKDLYAIDDYLEQRGLLYYSLVIHLYRNLEKFNAVVEGGRWHYYIHGGGVISGHAIKGAKDHMDVEDRTKPANAACPGLGAYIINQCWYGIGMQQTTSVPTIIVGDELGQNMANDSLTKPFMMMPTVKHIKTLPEALKYASETYNTENVLIFDGSYGFVNCSRSLAEHMIELAPKITEVVLKEKYPKYLKQRGLEPLEGIDL